MPLQNLFTDGRAMTASEVTRISDAIAGQTYALSTAGGAVTPSSGMTLAIAATAAGDFVIAGTSASAYGGGTATVTTSDPTNPRRDLVVINTAGTVSILPGTAAAVSATTGPVLPTPSSSQFALAEVYVGAGVTSISAGNITDRRQVTVVPAVSLAGSSSAATSTTSTSAVDLVTISNLSIPVTQGFQLTFNFRKTATNAARVAFGLKVNSTTVVDPTTSLFIGRTSGTNQAEDGISVLWCAPRSSANYLHGLAGYMNTFNASRVQQDNAALLTGGVTLTADMPNATITSMTIRAINDTSNNNAEVTSIRILAGAV